MQCTICNKPLFAKDLCKSCYNKKWRRENKEHFKQLTKSHYETNRKSIIAHNGQWNKAHPDNVKKTNAKRKIERRQYYRERYASDENYRIKVVLRNRLRTAIKQNHKTGSAINDLGCSIDEFKVYIEAKFESGMSWDNHGLKTWHLDHVVPLDSFDLQDPVQIKKACHYTNIQPMWAKDNLFKGSKT